MVKFDPVIPAKSETLTALTFGTLAATPGSYEKTVSILSNDTDRPTLRVAVRFKVKPSLAIDPPRAKLVGYFADGGTATLKVTPLSELRIRANAHGFPGRSSRVLRIC